MAYDLATAKIRLGIAADDTSKDVAIDTCLDMAQALAETYCDRGFSLAAEVQEIHGFDQRTLRTYRYPIATLNSVESVAPGASYTIALDSIVVFAKSGEIILSEYVGGTKVKVDYSGGYDVFPKDLEWALWGIFDAVWYSTPGMGIDAGADTTDIGPIKSFWINGVRLEYSISTSNAAASVNAAKDELYGILPLTSIAVLSRYRAESALSGG